MNIGIYHVDTNTAESDVAYVCAAALVKSARFHMPDVKVYHFTDMKSPKIRGVNQALRKPSEPMALLRMRHQAGVQGNWLFVDTDVIFQKKVTKVFSGTFDVAITTRDWPHLRAAVGFTERMPFNTGVMFSRCPAFWREAYTRLRELDDERQEWMGDQEVICEIVEAQEEERRYQIKQLRGYAYNFPPKVKDDTEAHELLEMQANIVHYKGPSRKRLMLERIKQDVKRCA